MKSLKHQKYSQSVISFVNLYSKPNNYVDKEPWTKKHLSKLPL